MKHAWWRSHLRWLADPAPLARFGDYSEVDEYLPFLTEALDAPLGSDILELGSGRGSVSIRLAQWGFRVTAVEQSETLIQMARASAERRGVSVDFRPGDAKAVTERGYFSGALIPECGLLTDLQTADLMRSTATALKPGGRLVFSTCNPYHWSRASTVEHRIAESSDVIRRFRFDFVTGRVMSRARCILASGERKDLPEVGFRAYTLPELLRLVTETGFADLKVYGEETDGRPSLRSVPDPLNTPFFHCVALKPVTGEAGDGI